MSAEKVLENISKMKGKKILVVGDVGLDEYVMGQVRRISPEAPVPVVEVTEEDKRLGLAANVTQNITGLGGEAYLVSVVGQDECAQQLKNILKQSRVNIDNLVVDKARPTTRKLRVMTGQHHIVRVDYEQKKYLSPEIEKQVIDQVSQVVSKMDGVIIQDYAKGVLSKSCIQSLVKIAKSHNKKILVDPHRTTPLTHYAGADIMTPNYDEALLLTKRELDDINGVSEDLHEVGNDLMRGVGSTQMIITRGKDGVSLFEDSKSKRIPTFARQVFDVTGAGDTFIASLSLAWVSGLSLEEACLIANHAAGVVVGKVGCVPCTLEELKESVLLRQ